MQTAVNRVLRVGRATMLAIGVGVSLALILGVATVALAAVPGDPFRLGRVNVINNAKTTLQGNGPSGFSLEPLLEVKRDGFNQGPALRVQNTSTFNGASGIRVDVAQGNAPISVNSGAGKANFLNVDRIDGKDSSAFLPSGTYVAKDTEFGDGNGDAVRASADCDPGDKLLGGGGNVPGDGDQVTFSSPFLGEGVQGWDYGMIDNDEDGLVDAFALCADFLPVHQN